MHIVLGQHNFKSAWYENLMISKTFVTIHSHISRTWNISPLITLNTLLGWEYKITRRTTNLLRNNQQTSIVYSFRMNWLWNVLGIQDEKPREEDAKKATNISYAPKLPPHTPGQGIMLKYSKWSQNDNNFSILYLFWLLRGACIWPSNSVLISSCKDKSSS